MRVSKIEIKKLFGMFDHVIPFNTEDRITIIHGPNGLGKTTVLRLLVDIFSMRFSLLHRTPFASIVISFDDRRRLRIKKTSPARSRPSEDQGVLAFTLYEGRKLKHHWRAKPIVDPYEGRRPRVGARKYIRRDSLQSIRQSLPWLARIGSGFWRDTRTGERLSFYEVARRYGDMLPFDVSDLAPEPKKWLSDLLGSLTMHLIETQRLSAETPEDRGGRSPGGDHRTAAVEQYSEDMASRIQETLRESGAVSASLDSTFPHRLLQAGPTADASDKRIRARYKEQSKYRDRLMAAGLIDPEEPVPLPKRRLQPTDTKVLWHYLDDVEKKLRVFDELLQKVELFKDIINTRFLYKSFSIDKSRGFVFSNANDVPLPSRALSSGEQHELVLAYQLIFKVSPRSLILIDEPELSLHVTWQHKFLGDLTRISELADLDFLIATHSPSIVHKRTDLMVPLEGPDG